jgi:predicted acylesterase/phospholipase RssA
MLGRLKMSVKDCEKAYDVVSEAIFGKLAGNAVTRELNSAAISFSAGSYMYAAEPLIEQVQGLAKKHLEGHLEEEKRTGDVMLINEDKDACKVYVSFRPPYSQLLIVCSFVVTCRANKTSTGQNVVKLRSYETKASPNEYTFPKIKIWEAARATSAAPAYFERVRLTTEDKEEHQFIDGGMVYNNPAPL